MELPWVYADFHNADEHGRLRLDGPATREDLARMETFTDVADVRRIRNHPLVPPDVPDHGYIYHVTTGCLVEVSEATEAGRAR
jgi:carbonic anhydrase